MQKIDYENKTVKNTIYILHESGAESHYTALSYLCKSKDSLVIYREFSIGKLLVKSAIKRDFKLFKKQFYNIFFIINLLLSKNKKVVLGIAPYDFRLLFLRYILKNHKVYYHTSWTCWDKSYFPKRLFVGSRLIAFWEKFLQENSIKIFAVTMQTKKQLIENVNIDENKINVVYHSFDNKVFQHCQSTKSKLKFLYVGRLVKEKGVDEILEYCKNNPDVYLSIVGNGSLLEKTKEYSQRFNNIEYLGYISDKNKLAAIYNEHDYLLLNSKKINTWQELFGMVIVEAMACGVIVVATNHQGPKEIIENNIDGYIVKEGEFIEKINHIVKNHSQKEYLKIQSQALKKAQLYTTKNIAKKWEDIFND